jgi:ABC-2 type transport system ATP-binding protein
MRADLDGESPLARRGTTLTVERFVRTYDDANTVGPISFVVEPGTCFGLVGANGAGKTTLLRSIVGLDEPTSGAIAIDGRPVARGQVNPGVSGMIEEPPFFGWLDGAANLRAAFPGRPISEERIAGVLREVGLDSAGRKPVRQYSQGMRQRLGLARVLLADPMLVVLDEPTNGLDPLGIRWLRDLIARMVEEGRSVLLSSHMLHEVQSLCSEFAMLDRGTVVAQGPMDLTSGHASLEEFYLSNLTDGSSALLR